MIDAATIQRARELLRRYLPETRMLPAPSLSQRAGRRVHLKLESELATGSFKPRGAIVALAANLERRAIREVVASSTGNHGAAVAFAAKLLGVPATVFLPASPNPVKRARIAELGARIVEEGRDLAEAFERAAAYATREGAYLLNDATDPDLVAGTATIGCEIVEHLPDTEVVHVPMGDTALVRGIGAALRQVSPGVRIVAVQAERAPAYVLSWRRGEPVATERCDTIADGLATRTPDPANVSAIREVVDDVRLVTEEQMLSAIRFLLIEERVLAEPAGAAATAALLASAEAGQGNAVALVTGANVAPEVLSRALATGVT